MKFAKTVQEYSTVLVVLQWAYLVATFGYAKWGFMGGALGLISSPALLPFSPFTAWLHSEKEVIIVFYVLLGVWMVAVGFQSFLRPRITSDYPLR